MPRLVTGIQIGCLIPVALKAPLCPFSTPACDFLASDALDWRRVRLWYFGILESMRPALCGLAGQVGGRIVPWQIGLLLEARNDIVSLLSLLQDSQVSSAPTCRGSELQSTVGILPVRAFCLSTSSRLLKLVYPWVWLHNLFISARRLGRLFLLAGVAHVVLRPLARSKQTMDYRACRARCLRQ